MLCATGSLPSSSGRETESSQNGGGGPWPLLSNVFLEWAQGKPVPDDTPRHRALAPQSKDNDMQVMYSRGVEDVAAVGYGG